MTSEGQGQTLNLLSRISRKRYEIKCQQKLDRISCMGFRMVKIFVTSVTFKGQGQILQTLKSNISKTVRD